MPKTRGAHQWLFKDTPYFGGHVIHLQSATPGSTIGERVWLLSLSLRRLLDKIAHPTLRNMDIIIEDSEGMVIPTTATNSRRCDTQAGHAGIQRHVLSTMKATGRLLPAYPTQELAKTTLVSHDLHQPEGEGAVTFLHSLIQHGTTIVARPAQVNPSTLPPRSDGAQNGAPRLRGPLRAI